MLRPPIPRDLTPVLLVLLLAALTVIALLSAALARLSPADAAGSAGRLGIERPDIHKARVIDGDTFEAEAELWPGLTVRALIRIEGLDAPELRGRCAAEKRDARKARDALAYLLETGARLREVQRDKYGGRFVAKVSLADGSDLAETLIAAGYARRYDGGRRAGWC